MGIFTKSKDNTNVKQETVVATPKIQKSSANRQVLHNYHLSEKTNQAALLGRYVFVVAKSANKIEVKKAVEAAYSVHVTSVNMVNVMGKNRRGRVMGKTQDWKKAVVTLKEGEKIGSLSEGA